MYIKIDSTDVSAYFRRASLKYQVTDFSGAIQDLNIILKRFPEYAGDAYSNRGMCYLFLREFDLSLVDLQKAKTIAPNDPTAYLNIAYAKSESKDYEGAILYLDTAIRLRPDYAKAFANRATAKKDLKKFNEAIKDYNRAIEINPAYYEAYLLRGDAKASLNKFDEGIADFNTALRMEPKLDCADFYKWRSAIYDKKGDKVKAQADLEKAVSLQ